MSIVNAIEPPVHISDAIRKASKATGADFSYLLTTAARESAFKQTAQARTSSAAGLFQFIDSTWLQTLKDEGPRFGLGEYANKIVRTESGNYYVPDKAAREKILRLRFDPEVASVMAGAFTKQNAEYLGSRIGRDPSQGELYIAHFLGAEGANKLISLSEDKPHDRADRHFPRAAQANRGIFYSHGTPNTLSQVYELLVSDHGRLEASTVATLPASEIRKLESMPEGSLAAKAPPETAPQRVRLAAASLLDAQPQVSGLFRGPVIGPPKIRIGELLSKGSQLITEAPAYRPATLGAPNDNEKLPEDTSLSAPGFAVAIARDAPGNAGGAGSIGVWTTIVRQPGETAGASASRTIENPARTERPAERAAEAPVKKRQVQPEATPHVRRAASREASPARDNLFGRAERFRSADFWQMLRAEGS